MKVAHIAIVTPRKCGLYETTRELVHGERELGIDARIVDPAPHPQFTHVKGEDRGVPLADMEWATTADLIVSHSGHDGTPIERTDQPILIAAHGRPISSWLMERETDKPAWSYHLARSMLDRYRGCVTFWPEYEDYFRAMWRGKPVHVVPSTVDMEFWSPGETTYGFAGRRGQYNVVMADPWVRKDVIPMPLVLAFDRFRQKVKGARLHIYGVDDNPRGIHWIKSLLGDSLGVIQGWAADLLPVYRAADMLISPQRIHTRSLREAMACGVQVVSGKEAHPEDVGAFTQAMMNRYEFPQDTRHRAKIAFDPVRAARVMRTVIEQHARQEATA